jgi:hypothetical protein
MKQGTGLLPGVQTLLKVLMAVPHIRQLVADISLWRPWLAPRTVHVESAVDNMALGQDSLSILFSPVNMILPLLHIHP